MSDSITPWTAAHQAPLSFIVYWTLLRFMSIESVMLSNHLILCCPLLLLPSIFPSISLFQWFGPPHQVAIILELQHQSFQWVFRVDFMLGLTGLILYSKGLSKVFSSTIIQKHWLFGAQPSFFSFSAFFMF